MAPGARLKILFKELGVNSAQVHRDTGLSTSSLSRYLSGERNPSQSALKKLKIAYQINANWLLTGEGPKFLGGNDSKISSSKGSEMKIDENSEVAKWKEKCLDLYEKNQLLREEIDALKAKKSKIR